MTWHGLVNHGVCLAADTGRRCRHRRRRRRLSLALLGNIRVVPTPSSLSGQKRRWERHRVVADADPVGVVGFRSVVGEGVRVVADTVAVGIELPNAL